MTMKMNNDLERAGDHAVNIAECSLYIIERPAIKPSLTFREWPRRQLGC